MAPHQQASPITGIARTQLEDAVNCIILVPPEGEPPPGTTPNPPPNSLHTLSGFEDDENARLCNELGLPAVMPLYRIIITEPFGWKDYWIYIVGTLATPEDPPDAPRFIDGVIFFRDGGPLPMIARLRQVYCRQPPLYLEALWRPGTRETISIRGIERLSKPTSTAYKAACAYMAQAHKLLQKIEGRGRRSGPDGFKDAQELEDTLVHLIQKAHAKGQSTKQEHIATLLRPQLNTRRRDIGSAASVEVDPASTSRYIRKHLSCPWHDLIKKALQTP